jgi:hypothetical protein
MIVPIICPSFHFLLDDSISPPDNDKRSKRIQSLSSRSTSSNSIESSSSDNPNVRINLAPISPGSELSKQTAAIERQLEHAALVEAAQQRTKKIKLFLGKYCCPQIGKLIFLIHLIFIL